MLLIQCDKSRDPFSHAPIQGNAGWHQAEVQRASTLGTMWDMFIVRAVLTSEIVAGLSFNLGSNFMEKVIYLASLFMLFFFLLSPILHPHCFSASYMPNSLENTFLLLFKPPVFGFTEKCKGGKND